jgi:hypothetical protein
VAIIGKQIKMAQNQEIIGIDVNVQESVRPERMMIPYGVKSTLLSCKGISKCCRLSIYFYPFWMRQQPL